MIEYRPNFYVLTGASGSGKSTLIAPLHQCRVGCDWGMVDTWGRGTQSRCQGSEGWLNLVVGH
jgi:ABC-type phosphate/phosphonate transport system ATPase subunit